MAAAGVGVTELANRMGESKQNVSRWANGERKLQFETATQIALILNVDVLSILRAAETDDERKAAHERVISSLEGLTTDELREVLTRAAAILGSRAA